MQAGIARTIRVLAVFRRSDPQGHYPPPHPPQTHLDPVEEAGEGQELAGQYREAEKDGGEAGTRQGRDEEAPERSMTVLSTIRLTLLRM